MGRNKGVVSLFIFGLLLGSLAACSGESSEQEATNQNEVAVQETIDEALAAEGEKVAKSSCTGCHGIDLTGDLGPNLHNLPYGKEQMIDILIKGGKTMPPATANGKEEEVAEYLMSLK